jgi:hypothetical protein
MDYTKKMSPLPALKMVNLFNLLFVSYYAIDYYQTNYKDKSYEVYDKNIEYENLMNFSYGVKLANLNYTIANHTFDDDTYVYFYEGINGTSHIYMNEHDIGFNFTNPSEISTDFTNVILPYPTNLLIKNDKSVMLSWMGLIFNSIMDRNRIFFDNYLIPISTYWTNSEGESFHITGLFELPMNETLSKEQTKSFYDRFHNVLIEL